MAARITDKRGQSLGRPLERGLAPPASGIPRVPSRCAAIARSAPPGRRPPLPARPPPARPGLERGRAGRAGRDRRRHGLDRRPLGGRAARGGPVRARPAVRRRRLPALARLRPLAADARRAGWPTGRRARASASCWARSRPAGCSASSAPRASWWPLPAWLAIVAFSALLAALWPVLLLPLFLRSEPMAGGRARRRAVGDRRPRPRARARAAAAQDGREDGGGKRDGGGPRADREDLRLRHAGRAGGGRGRGRRARPHPRRARPRARPPRAPRPVAAPGRLGGDARGGRRRRLGGDRGVRAPRRRPPLDAPGRRARVLARLGGRLAGRAPRTRAGASGPPTPMPPRSPARARRSRGRSSGSSRAT